MNENGYLIKFWAKTSHNIENPNAFHPLICHLIDVAVVAKLIWDKVLPTVTKKRIANAFGESEQTAETLETIGRLIAFIAGLHDLGKCSPPFTLRGKQIELQKENLEKKLAGQSDKTSGYAVRLHKKLQTINFLKIYEPTDFHVQGAVPVAKDAPHGYVTTVELPEILTRNRFGFNPKIAEQFSVLIGGHHGVFPNSEWRKNGRKAIKDNLGNEHWEGARIKLAETLADLLEIKPLASNATSKLDNGAIMILAGFVSVADWIGSDTQFFECEVEDFNNIKLRHETLENYFEYVESKAIEALQKLGWLNWTEYRQPKEFETLFPFTPRGSQIEAIKIAKEIEQVQKIGIFVVEDQMGNGKTETAMLLGDTLNAVLGQRGIYFALPTQATSNQMFGRVKNFLGKRFDKGLVQAQLLHGHAALSTEFETLQDDFKQIQDVHEECSGEDCVPHVVAAEWFTYRKRSLLAPFGVGTVDQALMAVLQTKHVFVRLFGLAHKTVIIDEVHAYDAYMSTLLERLLEWLAALGSPVILLSATLPKKRRDDLIKAYQRGLGIDESIKNGEDVYPRISYATDSVINVRHINSSAKTQTLDIEKVDEILIKESETVYKLNEEFTKKLKAKLKDGGCVAIICNTVKRSQDIYEQLSKDDFFKGNANDGLPKLDLLHSRFRFCDRDAMENRVRIRFGKEGEKVKITENGEQAEVSVKRPDFAVLVSTQIIEQSLDIDFDLMISDLAPVDLLLQRAGRLHRHDRERKDEFKKATLWIIEPTTDEQGYLSADKKGLPDFGKAGAVYDKHILLRTWLILKEIEKIEIPNGIEDLIEAAYNKKRECFDENYRAFWDKSKTRIDEKLDIKKTRAEFFSIMEANEPDLFTVKLLHLDEDDPPEKHRDLRAVTRDDELPSVSVIILKPDELKDLDLKTKPDEETTEFLLRREAKISKFDLTDKIIDCAELKPKGWKKSQYLRHYRLLRLNENNEINIDKYIVSLKEDLGIVIEEENKNG